MIYFKKKISIKAENYEKFFTRMLHSFLKLMMRLIFLKMSLLSRRNWRVQLFLNKVKLFRYVLSQQCGFERLTKKSP